VAVPQVVGHQRQAPDGDPPPEQHLECPAAGAPELHIEGAGTESHRLAAGGVVGVAEGEQQPARGMAPVAEPTPESFAHRPQQAPQFMAVVGVGGQLVFHATLGADLRRQHRTKIDAVRVAVQRASGTAEGHLQ
jgi:hypothetical protein